MKSFKSTFEQLQSDNVEPDDVKKEPLSKWVTLGEVNESNEKEQSQPVTIKTEIKDEETNERNQEVPAKSATKSNKKEKVIVFKKRKIESISLRERADE